MSGERIDLDMIEQRVIAAGDAWRGQKPASVAFLAYDATALLAEVRRLTAALAEANEARDIAQGQWRWYQARAERAEAALAEVAALADESRRTGKRLSALEVSDILARAEQTGADR